MSAATELSELINEFNYNHKSDGKFASCKKGFKKGSRSDGKNQSAADCKKGLAGVKRTKTPCGREGRLKGTYFRCRDGSRSHGIKNTVKR